MEAENKCLCSSSDVRIVACSGASNVGQIANQAAIDLAKANVGGFFCLAGVGAHVKGIDEFACRAPGPFLFIH
jgi:uncharacterized metal-binding protein